MQHVCIMETEFVGSYLLAAAANMKISTIPTKAAEAHNPAILVYLSRISLRNQDTR